MGLSTYMEFFRPIVAHRVIPCLWFKSIFLISYTILILGCAAIDHSESNRVSHLVGKDFKLLKASFIYESKLCGDVNQLIVSDFEHCNVIQVAGGCLPETNDMYKSDPNDAASKMKKCMRDRGSGWMKRTNKIIGYVPEGTIIRITKVVEHPYGSIGNFWIIRAKILDGEFENLEISLSGYYAFEPSWYMPLNAPLIVPQVNLEILNPVF